MYLLDKWTALVALLVAVVPLSLWQARDRQIYGDRKNAIRWLVGDTLFAVIAGSAIIYTSGLVPEGVWLKAATGFGPEWSCQMLPKAGKICFRHAPMP